MGIPILLRAVKTTNKFSPKSRTRTHLSVSLTTNTLCGKIVGVTWKTQCFAAVDCGQCLSRYGVNAAKRCSKQGETGVRAFGGRVQGGSHAEGLRCVRELGWTS